MGVGNSKKKEIKAPPPPDRKEIKTIFEICSKKIALFRNKKINAIKTKKKDIIEYLKKENLDFAKTKLESLIRDEEYVTVCDILGPFLELLLERFIYIDTSNECPADLRKQLDSIIYSCSRLEIEDFLKLRDIMKRKYGENYITKAENNADKFIDEFLIDKLQVKLIPESTINMRLKQIAMENQIPFNFAGINQAPGDLVQSVGGFNPYGNVNPYGSPSNFNNSQQGGNNLPPQNIGNPYGPPQDNGNPYGPPPDSGNPYGPQDNNSPYPLFQNISNSQFPQPDDNNQNPYTQSNNNSVQNPFASQNASVKSSSGNKFDNNISQENQNIQNSIPGNSGNNFSQNPSFKNNNSTIKQSDINVKVSQQNVNNSLGNQSKDNNPFVNNSINNSENSKATGAFNQSQNENSNVSSSVKDNNNNENNNNAGGNEFDRKKTQNPYDLNREYTHDEEKPMIKKGESKSINDSLFGNPSTFNLIEKSQIEQPKEQSKSINPKSDYNPKEDV